MNKAVNAIQFQRVHILTGDDFGPATIKDKAKKHFDRFVSMLCQKGKP